MKSHILTSIRMLLVMMSLTGVLYPVLMTIIGQLMFQSKSNGSLIERNGKIIGSELIAQKFQTNRYFWARPSAIDYNPDPSGGSNLGPTNKVLRDAVEARRKCYLKNNFLPSNTIVPKEMLFASGSGIDPHISPEAAILQIERVARARGFDEQQQAALRQLVSKHIEELQFGFLGERRVNVLLLNMELDSLK